MSRIKVSDYIAKRLKEHGVEHFFMVSGGGAMHLNDSLGRVIPYTACHHEQACAIMAEGYARVNQKLGVVNVTTGPGGLNCLNGVFGQWTDSVPVLYISGQVKFSTTMSSCPELKLRQLGDQEVDIISTVKHLTKYAKMVTEPKEIKYHIDRAIYEATTGRFGPVWLDIPMNVQSAIIDEDELVEFDNFPLRPLQDKVSARLGEGYKNASLSWGRNSTSSKFTHLYTQQSLNYSKELRKNLTTAENILWFYLRKRQMCGIKFRKQSPIGQYIVDFVSYENKLIIELDGSQHLDITNSEHDKVRDKFLTNAGYTIKRYYNNDIYNNINMVLEDIYSNCVNIAPHPNLPPQGVIPPPPTPPPQGGRGQELNFHPREAGKLKNNYNESIFNNDTITPSPLEGEGWGGGQNQQIQNIISKLQTAKSPLLIAGHGIRLSNQIDNFYKLIEKLKIPVVSTFNGFDIMETDNPYYIGRIGTIGQRAGNFALQNADLILCLGTRNNIRQVSYNWENFAKNAYKIIVDIDEMELEKPLVKPDMAICCNLSDFIPELLKIDFATKHLSWLKFCQNLKQKYCFENHPEQVQKDDIIDPYHFTYTLTKCLKENDIVVMANGSACVCTFQNAIVKKGQRYILNSGNASMGYGLPCAIGACYQNAPNPKTLPIKGLSPHPQPLPLKGGGENSRDVICIEGDGSIMMNLQELQTLVYNKLPLKLFVINNNGYSSIRQTQRNFFEGRMTGSGIDSGVSVPNFVKIGSAFGLKTKRINNPKTMENDIKEVLNTNGSILAEVMVENEYAFLPKLSSRTLEDGSMVSASLEDMFPFLDRDEFRECIYDNRL